MEHLFLMFLDHTQRRTTVGRTPLDEWSARRRGLYLTTHDTHNRQISMPPVGFEPKISAGERPLPPPPTLTPIFNLFNFKSLAKKKKPYVAKMLWGGGHLRPLPPRLRLCLPPTHSTPKWHTSVSFLLTTVSCAFPFSKDINCWVNPPERL